MFQRLLVPLDGSPLAETAVSAAATAARATGGRIVLLHLLERGAPSSIHGTPHLVEEEAARRYLQEVSGRLTGLPVDLHVHPESVDRVPEAIVEHAVELGCDVVVLCTHGRGGMRHRLFGTIADRVVRLGRVPVLAVPPGPTVRDHLTRRLLLAFDPRPGHGASVEAAAAAARSLGASVDVLAVAPTRATLAAERAPAAQLLPGTTDELLALEARELAVRVTDVADRLGAAGLEARGLVARGAPAPNIERAAHDLDVDYVILATHGRGGLAAFWEGSVGARLLRGASVPLLLVAASTEGEG